MSETTKVWVRTPALELSVTGHASTKSKRGLPGGSSDDDEPIDWGWAYAELSEMVTGQPIQVSVNDENSPHHGVTTKLPADAMKTGDIVMGNKYGSDEVDYGDEEEDSVDRYPDDLITLTHLHEPAVVHCLRQRYAYDKIYTATGPILLALNPFKNCKSLYSQKVMKAYFERGEASMSLSEDALPELEPHVYAIADHSFRIMMKTIKESREGGGGGVARKALKGSGAQKTCDQSILVSGESGAGKTVTTKFIMQYLATLSQRSHGSDSKTVAPSSGKRSVEQQVLQSNPILESFGNARTIRNDNSSRFGKFIEIQFSDQGGLLGASIQTYLLEKVRLISQAEGERNYHIFYEIFCMPEEDLDKFFMDGYTVEDFRITNQSGTFDRRDGVEDYETHDEMRQAMETMGITKDEQDSVLEIPCAALHASNITFIEKSADESALDTDNLHLQPFCELMGISAESLEKAMCFLKIKAGRESNIRTLPKSKAEKGMEALIKAFYGALFTFLVRRVNESITIKPASGGSRARRGARSSGLATIGVLDIFGFESFKHNSFEQLCINYCNEALQQQFNLFVLKNEQAEYEREGIEWSFISFPDNQDVLDLIDKKGSGILNILDDQCRAPGTTDKTFCIDLYKKCTPHGRFEADYRQVGAQRFSVNHYAGPVEYDTLGFVEKNRDDLPKEACDLLKGSTKEIVRALASIISDPTGSSSKDSKSRSLSPVRSKTKVTVGGQFSKQLHDLRSKIDLTSPHYVRCLKPNDVLVPDHFNPLIISDQLRYAGVIEAVRVSRVGYPQRYTHSAFTSRYRILALQELKKAQRASRKMKSVNVVVNALLPKMWVKLCEQDDEAEKKDADVSPSMIAVGVQVGKTKVFLRRRPYEILEQLRLGKMVSSATTIQAAARRYIHERDYIWTVKSVRAVQSIARMKAAKAQVHVIRINDRATRIQTRWRTKSSHKHFLVLKAVAKWLQRVHRGRIARKLYNKLNRERKATIVQACWRRFHHNSNFRRVLGAVICVQCAVRCMWAQKEMKTRKMQARDLGSAKKERDQLRNEVQAMRKKMLEQASALKVAQQVAADAVSKDELEASKAEVANLLEKLVFVEKARDELASQYQREKGRADAQESQLQEQKASSEAALAQLMAENKTISDKLKESEVEISMAKVTVETIEKKVEEANSRAEKAEKAVSEAKAIVESQSVRNETLQNEVDELRESVTVLQEDNSKLSGIVESSQAETELLQQEKHELLAKCADNDSKIANLTSEHAKCGGEAANLSAENTMLKDEIQSIRRELTDLKASLKETKVELEEARTEKKEVEFQSREVELKLREAELQAKSAERELIDTQKEMEEQSVAASFTATSTVAAEELVVAKRTIEQLERDLQIANDKTAGSLEVGDPEIVKKFEEMKAKYKRDMGKADTAIKELKQDLRQTKEAMESGAPLPVEDLDDRAAEEILNLQDEVNRLEKELSQSRKNSTEPSPQELITRYSELSRLANACLEKDDEIERLKAIIDDLDVNGPMPNEYHNSEESDHLKLYINELQKEIDGLREQLDQAQSGTGKGRGSLARRKAEEESSRASGSRRSQTSEASETVDDMESEIEALKEVNEMLRKDVELSRKKIRTLEKELDEEKERAREELEAFSKTLRGVDDLRVAAETMSRQVNRIKKKPLKGDGAIHGFLSADEALTDEDFDDMNSQIMLEGATKMIDEAAKDFENTHKEKTSKQVPFWNFTRDKDRDKDNASVTSHEVTDAEEVFNSIMKAKKKRRRKKAKRRGSNGSIVSSFF